MEQRSLKQRVDGAFSVGDNSLGLSLLRELSIEEQDAATYHRLAVIEEQIGLPGNATAAHLKCLEMAPDNPLSYLFAGYWLQQQGREEEALNLYSLGADLNPDILMWGQNPSQSQEMRIRSAAADRSIRHFLTAQHRTAVGTEKCVDRVQQAIWTRTHNRPFQISGALQKPQLFYLPDLGSSKDGLYDQIARGLPWVDRLEANADKIGQELEAALPRIREEGRPYLDQGMQANADVTDLAGSFNWTALDLYREGRFSESLASQLPVTMEILLAPEASDGIPHYCLNELPYEVFFSILAPGQHIKPHYGLSNHSLTVHLPLVVPANCWLRVGGRKHQWREGELVAFDDTFEHEAYNGSQQERIVLLFSIWHPALTLDERSAIQRSFSARKTWLSNRVLPTGP